MQPDDRHFPASPGVTSLGPPAVDPLGHLALEHGLQLELCDALQLIADGLPHRFEPKLVGEVINVLVGGLTHHFEFEEEVLFPLLRRRAAPDSALVAALDQLEIEHGRDDQICSELAEELRYFLLEERPRNAEMLGYMLRGFFEGQRRHVEWENTIVLPAAHLLLTSADKKTLALLLEQVPAKPSSIFNLPRRQMS